MQEGQGRRNKGEGNRETGQADRFVQWRMPTRRLLCRALLSCACLAFTSSLARAQDDPDGWKKPTTPVKIVGPIHYVGTYGLCGVSDRHAGGPHPPRRWRCPGSGPDIVRSIEAARIQAGATSRFSLTTQAHVRSRRHARRFCKQATGARVLVMQGDEGTAGLGRKDRLRVRPATPSITSRPVKVDQVIEDGHVVSARRRDRSSHAARLDTRPGTTTWTTTVRRRRAVVSRGLCRQHVRQPGDAAGQEPLVSRHRGGLPAVSARLLESLPVDMYLAAHAQAVRLPRQARTRDAPKAARAFVDPDALRKAVATSPRGVREADRSGEVTPCERNGEGPLRPRDLPWQALRCAVQRQEHRRVTPMHQQQRGTVAPGQQRAQRVDARSPVPRPLPR